MQADSFEIPKIDRGVPIPPRKRGMVKYNFFDRMTKGDSVVLKKQEAAGCFHRARKLGIQTTPRKVGPDAFRVWRLS